MYVSSPVLISPIPILPKPNFVWAAISPIEIVDFPGSLAIRSKWPPGLVLAHDMRWKSARQNFWESCCFSIKNGQMWLDCFLPLPLLCARTPGVMLDIQQPCCDHEDHRGTQRVHRERQKCLGSGSIQSCSSSPSLPHSRLLGPHLLKPSQQGFCSTQHTQHLNCHIFCQSLHGKHSCAYSCMNIPCS